MNLPDSFPKQFTLRLAISMEELMGASMFEWGKILKNALNNAEATAVEQIRDYRLREMVFRYCGSDPGEGFKVDYYCNWVTTDDGMIQFLRMDMLPISERTFDSEIGLLSGTYEEFTDERGQTLVREVLEDLKTNN